jgi:hypothetical protein
MEDKNFVDICPVCKQGVSKSNMDFQKGKVFHIQCFTEHGGTFPTPDKELAYLNAKTRIELVQMKNLKVRTELGELKPVRTPANKARKKHVTKNKGKKAKARKTKSKKAKTKKAKKRR